MSKSDRMLSASIDLTAWSSLPPRALLFGEAQARIIVSTSAPGDVERIAAVHRVPARRIGAVEPQERPFRIRYAGGEIVSPVSEIAAAYHDASPSIMTRVAVADDALAVEASSTVSN